MTTKKNGNGCIWSEANLRCEGKTREIPPLESKKFSPFREDAGPINQRV